MEEWETHSDYIPAAEKFPWFPILWLKVDRDYGFPVYKEIISC